MSSRGAPSQSRAPVRLCEVRVEEGGGPRPADAPRAALPGADVARVALDAGAPDRAGAFARATRDAARAVRAAAASGCAVDVVWHARACAHPSDAAARRCAVGALFRAAAKDAPALAWARVVGGGGGQGQERVQERELRAAARLHGASFFASADDELCAAEAGAAGELLWRGGVRTARGEALGGASLFAAGGAVGDAAQVPALGAPLELLGAVRLDEVHAAERAAADARWALRAAPGEGSRAIAALLGALAHRDADGVCLVAAECHHLQPRRQRQQSHQHLRQQRRQLFLIRQGDVGACNGLGGCVVEPLRHSAELHLAFGGDGRWGATAACAAAAEPATTAPRFSAQQIDCEWAALTRAAAAAARGDDEPWAHLGEGAGADGARAACPTPRARARAEAAALAERQAADLAAIPDEGAFGDDSQLAKQMEADAEAQALSLEKEARRAKRRAERRVAEGCAGDSKREERRKRRRSDEAEASPSDGAGAADERRRRDAPPKKEKALPQPSLLELLERGYFDAQGRPTAETAAGLKPFELRPNMARRRATAMPQAASVGSAASSPATQAAGAPSQWAWRSVAARGRAGSHTMYGGELFELYSIEPCIDTAGEVAAERVNQLMARVEDGRLRSFLKREGKDPAVVLARKDGLFAAPQRPYVDAEELQASVNAFRRPGRASAAARGGIKSASGR